jgi:hypothetical protein
MTFAEIRKAIVAAAALIATAAPQLLVFGDLLPQSVALAITVVAIIAGVIGVWAVPNKSLTDKVSETLYSAQDLIPIIRKLAREEVAATNGGSDGHGGWPSATGSTPPVQAQVREPEKRNPFAIPPLGSR